MTSRFNVTKKVGTVRHSRAEADKKKRARAELKERTTGWILVNGSIVRGTIADTPAAHAESDALGVRKAAWEAGLPRPNKILGISVPVITYKGRPIGANAAMADLKKSDVYKVAASVAAVVTSPITAPLAAITGNKELKKGVANVQDVKNTVAVVAAVGLAAVAVSAIAAAGAASGGVAVMGSSTGLSTGIAVLDTAIGSTLTGGVVGAGQAALTGKNIKKGAEQGATNAALNSAGAVVNSAAAAVKPYLPDMPQTNFGNFNGFNSPQFNGGAANMNTNIGSTLAAWVGDAKELQSMINPPQAKPQVSQFAVIGAPAAVAAVQAAQPAQSVALASWVKPAAIGGGLLLLGLVALAVAKK